MKKKIKIRHILKAIILIIYAVLVSIIKSIIIDFPKNIKETINYALNPELRKKIKDDLEMKKQIELIDERVKILERLMFAINQDASYLKTKKGKYDLKKLEKEVK